MKNFIQQLLAVVLSCLLAVPAEAAFGAQTQWDVAPGVGSDTNGGAFDPKVASPGTDESLSGGAAITVTLTGTNTGTASPAFSSTTHGPGNFIHIASGTGCTTGWFEINSVSGSTATFDKTMGSNTNVCVGHIGDPFATVGVILTNLLNSNAQPIWIRSGTLTLTSVLDFSEGGSNRTSIYLIGYGTTHGDNGTKPLITTATDSTNLMTTANASSLSFTLRNIAFTNTASTRASALILGTNATWGWIVDCTFSGFNKAVDLSGGGVNNSGAGLVVMNSSFINDQSSALLDTHGSEVTVLNSYFFGNVNGIQMSSDSAGNANGLYVANTILSGNSGRGILLDINQNNRITVVDSTISGNTSDGIGWNGVNTKLPESIFDIRGNIIYGNGGYGLNLPTAMTANQIRVGPNGWGANNGGGTGLNYTTSVPAGTGDVSFGATPFTNSGGQDLSLNSTTNGGALARSAGIPGAFPGGGSTTTGYHDLGAVTGLAPGTSGSPAGAAFVQ